jgi:hypothetical protein
MAIWDYQSPLPLESLVDEADRRMYEDKQKKRAG